MSATMVRNACRYGRSYDVSLVQRKYLGKVIIALNIMWKYREQVSFGVSRPLQEQICCLDTMQTFMLHALMFHHKCDCTTAANAVIRHYATVMLCMCAQHQVT